MKKDACPLEGKCQSTNLVYKQGRIKPIWGPRLLFFGGPGILGVSGGSPSKFVKKLATVGAILSHLN